MNLKVVSETLQPGGKVTVVLEPQPGILTGAARYYARVRAVQR